MQFSKLYAPSLKDLFIQQFQGMILSGELEVGTRLPSERELAEQLQVSRSVVNGGMVELARQGFLEVRPRQGTYVADYRRNGNIDTLIAIINYNGGVLRKEEIRSILELRMGLEHITARRAIEFASDKDISSLKQYVDALGAEPAPTPAQAAEIAFQFHHELTVIGGNHMLPLIYSSFKIPVITLWERFCRHYGADTLYQNTKQLYTQIAGRNLAGADAWIDQYISDAISGSHQIYQ